MSLILKGVIDLTCSIFYAVIHVIRRDLTNYYWDIEELQLAQQNEALSGLENCDIDGDSLISNFFDEECNNLKSTQENERSEFLDNVEDKEKPQEIFCTSLNNDDSATDLDENYSIEDNTAVLNGERTVNNLRSPKKENCIWTEIAQHFDLININVNYPKTSYGECSENKFKTLEGDYKALPEGESTNLREVEAESSQADDTADGITLDCTDTEGKLEENDQKSENIIIGDRNKSELDLQNHKKLDESIDCKFIIQNLQNCALDECPIFDKSNNSNQNKDVRKNKPIRSKISRYIGTRQQITTNATSTLLKGEDLKQPNTSDETTPTKPLSLMSDEIENIPKSPKTFDEIMNAPSLQNKTPPTSEEHMNAPKLQNKTPPTSDEHMNALSLQNKTPSTSDEPTSAQSLQNTTNKSDKNITPDEAMEFHYDLSDILQFSRDESDARSACSNCSSDSWINRFLSLARPKSPETNGSSNTTAKPGKGDGRKVHLCDCVNSHSCLLVVDSDDDLAEDLLTSKQLGSVETGSVSDWLYRVKPSISLLPSEVNTEDTYTAINNTEDALHEIQSIEYQKVNTNIKTESSDEDLVMKTFYVKQWLDNTEVYYNAQLIPKLTGSGDNM